MVNNSIQLFIAGFLENKKAAENQRLHYSWFQFVAVDYNILLADAEMRKYILQHHIICHFPCYIG